MSVLKPAYREARGRRVLFAAAAIIVSIVVYVKKQRSKKINNSTEHQEMASYLLQVQDDMSYLLVPNIDCSKISSSKTV